MGLLALNRLLSLQRHRQRRRHQIRARSRLTASAGKRKGSPCQQDDDDDADSQAGKVARMAVLPDLPEDILLRIHSLMPMREAARAACLSHAFLHSWRYHPNLIFNEDTVKLKKSVMYSVTDRASAEKAFHRKVDRVLRKHKGGLKTFELDYNHIYGLDDLSYFDTWLHIVLKPGLEQLSFLLTEIDPSRLEEETETKYSFPCALLSDRVGDSLRRLTLCYCALQPTVESFGPLRSLTSLSLWCVSITWDELELFLSNSLALEVLDLRKCHEIECLKLSCALQRLNRLRVSSCTGLRVIESKAPNLSSFYLCGCWQLALDLSLVEASQMKTLDLEQGNLIHDARAKLPPIMPNIETLVLQSPWEVVDAPMLPTKFLRLKHLAIYLVPLEHKYRPYDYFSLVSFLDASPSLETLELDVTRLSMLYKSVFADSQLRHMPEHRHGCLKNVKITGFSSAKCLIELTCYILKNAVSLECLTLDTIYGPRCYDESKVNRCYPMPNCILVETFRALSAIRTYIVHKNKVPSTVKLTVMEPCSKCHAKGLQRALSQQQSCDVVVSV